MQETDLSKCFLNLSDSKTPFPHNTKHLSILVFHRTHSEEHRFIWWQKLRGDLEMRSSLLEEKQRNRLRMCLGHHKEEINYAELDCLLGGWVELGVTSEMSVGWG